MIVLIKNKTSFYSACLFLLSVTICFSQNAKDDLLTINKKFSSLQSYEMNVEVKVFANDIKPKFISKAKTAKSNGNYFLSMLNRKTIVNNDLMIIVDDQQKIIMYSKISKEQIKALANSQGPNLDSLLKNQKINAKYIVDLPTDKKIEVISENGDVSSTILGFNPKTLVLKEIVYIYSAQGKKNTGNARVVITYPDFSFNIITQNLFDQTKYITRKGEKVFATEKYKKYQLIQKN